MDALNDTAVDLALILRQRTSDRYRADIRLRRPGSASDYDLAVDRPVALDPIALNALLPNIDAYGGLLFEQLFADDTLRTAWAQGISLGQATGQPLRLRLDLDPQIEALHRIIWEALRDPDSRRPIGMSERVLLSRYLGSADLAVVPAGAALRPRAVVAVAGPSGLERFQLDPVDVAGEVERMRAALGTTPTTILGDGQPQRATLDAISAALREGPAILYLACHGTITAGQPFLWLETADGQIDRVAGADLVAAVQGLAARPLLIILGSCRSGGDGDQVLPALAPALVRAGVPAVIGAQGDVAMALVAAMLPVFVRELLRDGQVDRALAAARATLRGRPDWWRPALWMHLRDGQIWQTTPQRPQLLRPASETAIRCNHLRISFIWAETFDRPPRVPSGGAPLDMGSEERAAALFEASRSDGRTLEDGTRILPPWPKLHGQHFWYAYLERRSLGSISGHQAYRALVPLRLLLPWSLSVAGFSGDAEAEGFCYPHGVACVVTVRCTEEIGLREAINLAPMIRRARLLTLSQPDGSRSCSLDELAEQIMARLSALRTGRPDQRGRAVALEPFSVASILRGQAVAPALPLESGGLPHQLLEALTRWQIPPEDWVPTDLAQARLPVGTPETQAGDVLYSHERGRAVWFPRRFAQEQPSSALGCYQRNLVFAALQTESLGGLIQQTAAQIADGQPPGGIQRAWAQRAYGLLSRLYCGNRQQTYRTMSSQRHIIDNAFLADLNIVRQHFGSSPLPE